MERSLTFKKSWILIVNALLIAGIASSCGGDSSSDKNSSSSSGSAAKTAAPAKEQQWTTVYTFKGSGMKKSPVFELTGNDAKITYSYKAPSGLGMGMFTVYVVDQGEDVMKTGGIPEVMVQSESEESESSLQKSAGKYYLDVNASGNWTVTVQEKK